jgi:hypothetical protein
MISKHKNWRPAKKLHSHMDHLLGILSIYWQAYDAAFGGNYKTNVDSLTYALSALDDIAL